MDNKHIIQSIEVYNGGARVTRAMSVNLVKGQNEFTLSGISEAYDRGSFEAVCGTAEILSITSAFRNICGTTVKVSIFAAAAEQATLLLTAFTYSASWSPNYRIDADLNKPLRITLRAALNQNTGEDWTGAKLCFIPLSAQRTEVAPEFKPEYLGLDEPTPIRPQMLRAASMERSIAYCANDSFDGDMITAQESENCTVFTSALPVEILSGGSAVINLKTYTLKAAYSYNCFAAVSAAVYLVASLEKKTNFISGKASVFMDGRNAGNTNISGALDKITLGRDERISVSREEGNSYKSNKLLGGSRAQCDFRLKVTSGVAAELLITDRIPVSSHKSVEIIAEKTDGATFDGESGKLEWLLNLKSGDSKEISVTYRVEKK